jgi:hypothetical protein
MGFAKSEIGIVAKNAGLVAEQSSAAWSAACGW